ncbi:MAG: hypothetical protein U0930_06055 [Pirellulales bacterium]
MTTESKADTKPALIVALHGIGDTAQSMAEYSKLDRLAQTAGIVLAIPEAKNQMWKAILPEGQQHD